MNVIWFIAVAVLVYCCVSEDPIGNWDDYFTYDNILAEEGEDTVIFQLYWKDIHDDYNKSNDVIEFGMEVRTTGWIAIGISPNAFMPNSDIMLGWVSDDGEVYLYDMNTKSERITPFLDEQQDLTLKYGAEIDGVTRIRFSRPKFLCNDDDRKVAIGTTRILWAYNPSDPTSISGLLAHTEFGRKSINLDVGYQTLASDDIDAMPDIIVSSIKVDTHPIPPQETEYYCELFELPQLDEVHHIVKFAPYVSKGMEPYVHHLNLYHCPVDKVNVSNIGHGAPCDTWGVAENMPSKACIGLGVSDAIHVIYAWGVGMVDSVLPEDIGVEIGGNASDALRYGMLEMHYDNPNHHEGLIDHSGFTMYYTPNLRNISAGLMTVGHFYDEREFIPQGYVGKNYGYCHHECTEIGLPEGGVHVFGVFLHGHPIATALNLKHVRNGKELAPIESDWSYDFDYQQMVATDDITILPGDDLILECYENNYRNRTTFGGIETSTEMCLAFLWVYPKPELRTCTSTFPDEELTEWANGAKDKGYLNNKADILAYAQHYNNKHNIPFNYDITRDGAIDYYNNFWIENNSVTDGVYSQRRKTKCYDKDGDPIWHDDSGSEGHAYNIPQYEPRKQNDNEMCYNYQDVIGGTQSSDKNINVIIGVSIAAGVVFILIIVFAVIFFKERSDLSDKNKAGNSKYSQVNNTNTNIQTAELSEEQQLNV